MKKYALFFFFLILISCKNQSKNQFADYPATNQDSTINVVIEIPAGTLEKYELNKNTQKIEWEIRDKKPRIVQYLAYPANYGFIPNTILPKAKGGDGDPLDVLVLGAAIERESIIKAKPIGILKLLDSGEKDDKIIAISSNSPFSEIKNLEELKNKFPGILNILEIWFENYKGKNKIISLGFENKKAAWNCLTKFSQ